MKCTIPEISWHNRDPVLSVDVHCNHNEFYKLASGGTDCHVLIWRLKIRNNGAVDINIVSDLSRHQKSVNVVRWSPTGTYLATGDDDAHIIIWNLKTDNIPLLEETNDEEVWLVTKILRGHKEDVYDISWSPNEMKLISGSIDNTAILWDFAKGQSECILSDHKGFVQGVTWDPKGDFIATICSDRICRVFDGSGKHIRARLHKGILPIPEADGVPNQEYKFFHDDTFKSYFRRLNYSPDGNLLIVPSGCIETANGKVARNATYLFAVTDLSQPVAVIPSPKQITIAVRCCPILFELHDTGSDPLITLPYRMIIAIATDSDVVLYDTQQVAPFAHLRKIHYTRITDLAWSSDGLLLVASSTDGFCTLITFQKEELGVQYTKEESDPDDSILNVSGCEELANLEIDNRKKEKEEVEIKKPTVLEKWAIRAPNVEANGTTSNNEAIAVEDQQNKMTDTVKLKPKRIVPIRLGDCSKKNLCETNVIPTVVVHDDEPTVSNTIIRSDSTDNTAEVSPKAIAIKNKDETKDKSGRQSITSKQKKKKNSILNFFQSVDSVKINSAEKLKSIPRNDVVVVDLCDSDTERNDDESTSTNVEQNISSLLETDSGTSQPPSEKENAVLVNVDNTSSNLNTEMKTNTLKKPRRIPLITLGSPKRKKKE